PRGLAVADLTGDGIPDVITADYNSDTLSMLIGKGDGTFFPREILPVGARPYSVAVADLNGDDRPDLIVADSGSHSVSVLMNLGTSGEQVRFEAQRVFSTGRRPFSVAVAKLSANGIPDIVAANAFDNTVSVLIGDGNGLFQPQQVFAVGERPYSLAVADINGDG